MAFIARLASPGGVRCAHELGEQEITQFVDSRVRVRGRPQYGPRNDVRLLQPYAPHPFSSMVVSRSGGARGLYNEGAPRHRAVSATYVARRDQLEIQVVDAADRAPTASLTYCCTLAKTASSSRSTLRVKQGERLVHRAAQRARAALERWADALVDSALPRIVDASSMLGSAL